MSAVWFKAIDGWVRKNIYTIPPNPNPTGDGWGTAWGASWGAS